jgi:hypothetical protein
MDIISIKFGFKIGDTFFGWCDGKLYQLPYTYNGRYYGLREIKRKALKNGWVYYRIKRVKVGVEKLRAMLEAVEWDVTKPQELN